MNNKITNFTLRIEENLLEKLKYISQCKGHSFNSEIRREIERNIKEFEKEHGVIDTDKE